MRFFADEPLVPGDFTLVGPEAHHLADVLRAQPGDRVTLFNGDGCDYPAEILGVGKKRVTLQILERIAVQRERAHRLIIASAMPKGDRGDFLIEKLTELGVSEFVPMVTERTVVIPKESRIDSLRRSVVEASKQCGRNTLMVIHPPMKWAEFLAQNWPVARYLLHPSGAEKPGWRDHDAIIAIGPEGGFTNTEAAVPGWQRVSLGPRILRIETAAIAAAV